MSLLSNLPEGIHDDIFLWLPAESILSCRNMDGVKESWIKKYTTTQLPSPSSDIPFWRPLWYFDNGEILVDNDRRQLLLYNPTTEKVRSVVVREITVANIRQSYVESIVSVGSGTYLEKRITDGVVKNSEPQRLRQSIPSIRRSCPLLKWRKK
ncbi:uncharacterized protein LOC113353274 isoform X2 [Papaver somniferum]|uniref:uncharacterized protein LOC113353274 isoform X2 n=1 Tax=Papaver somniferum TaxID=3469 RepID=UPI000E6F482E|nr:uncharacterized protein LOC113353274 isoform X2 [Papaver somniferum]XP_026452711.1 uncharacterized protein LOC113353274 isoform X2 [Papaver somniferum]